MNEEYLWNKTGGDAEIEGLENALKAFSYKPIAPPELPAKVFALETKPRRRFALLAFAFGTFVIVALAGTWFLIPNRSIAITDESAKILETRPIVRQPDDVPVAKTETPTPEAKRSITKTHYVDRPTAKPTTAVSFKPKARNSPVKLTAEEKYAYGQLMLALSITESKLKVVKDAIDGNE